MCKRKTGGTPETGIQLASTHEAVTKRCAKEEKGGSPEIGIQLAGTHEAVTNRCTKEEKARKSWKLVSKLAGTHKAVLRTVCCEQPGCCSGSRWWGWLSVISAVSSQEAKEWHSISDGRRSCRSRAVKTSDFHTGGPPVRTPARQ